MKKLNLVITFAAAGLFALAPAMAQTEHTTTKSRQHEKTTTSTTAKTKTEASSDARFVKEAAEDYQAEIQMGKLAQDKGATDAVKQFGKQLIEDHTNALNQLQQVAQTKNITLETKLDKKQQAEYDRLSKLSGSDFDHAFVRHEITDHKGDIAAFRREADRSKDADIKNFAQQQISGLEHHLHMAESLQKSNDTSLSASTATSKPRTKTGY